MTTQQTQRTHPREAEEGITHINLSDNSNSELGVALYQYTENRFQHPKLGEFASLGAVWRYVKSGGKIPEYRHLTGRNFRLIHGEKADESEEHFYANFQDMIGQSIYCLLQQNDHLRELALANTLPFDLYYMIERDGTRMLHYRKFKLWYLPLLDEVIRMIRCGEPYPEVDYSELLKTAQ